MSKIEERRGGLKRRATLPIVFTLCMSLLLAACGSSKTTPTSSGAASAGSISVEQAWSRPAPAGTGSVTPASGMAMASASPGSMAMSGTTSTDAVYFTIHNSGSQPDELVAASSSVATTVQLHKSQMVNGVMTMQPVQSITVNAGGQVQFQPGGYHVMLVGLKRDLNVGDTFQVTLTFKQAGAITVPVEVKQQ